MVTVEEAERKLRRRGAMRSHLVAVFLTACVSLSATVSERSDICERDLRAHSTLSPRRESRQRAGG